VAAAELPGAGGALGILGKASNDEGSKEQRARLHCTHVVDGDSYGSAAPPLAVEQGELVVAYRKRIALTPATCRAESELASAPAQRPAAAPEAARLECPRRATGGISHLDRSPKSAAREAPGRAVGLGGRSPSKQSLQAKRADTFERIKATSDRSPGELEVGHASNHDSRGLASVTSR
jgi:hypothetical protein